MSANSAIEWTQATWNPVSGCTRVSAGCDNCYAVKMTNRLEAMGQAKYAGLTVVNSKGDRHFNGKIHLSESDLAIPLKRKKPTVYFVNSMSDLFHKGVPFEFIYKVFAVMELCQQHTFQILTKRPERMADYLTRRVEEDDGWQVGSGAWDGIGRVLRSWREGNCDWLNEMNVWSEVDGLMLARHLTDPVDMPLPNVWLGTSVENKSVLSRIDHLRQCPADIRFLSLEPLLEDLGVIDLTGIHWVIVGGESGPGARPFYVNWADDIRDQCAVAGVPFFMKQMGSNVRGIDDEFGDVPIELKNKKGGDMSEFPEDLRVREMPAAVAK